MGYWQKPSEKPKLLNSLQYLDYIDQAFNNSNGTENEHFFQPKIYEYAEKYFKDPRNNEAVFFDETIDRSLYQYVGNTNWWDQIYKKNSFSQQYNASISGGNDRTTYYSSFTYNNVEGLYKNVNDNYQKVNAFMHIKTNITNWLSVSVKCHTITIKEIHHPMDRLMDNQELLFCTRIESSYARISSRWKLLGTRTSCKPSGSSKTSWYISI